MLNYKYNYNPSPTFLAIIVGLLGGFVGLLLSFTPLILPVVAIFVLIEKYLLAINCRPNEWFCGFDFTSSKIAMVLVFGIVGACIGWGVGVSRQKNLLLKK